MSNRHSKLTAATEPEIAPCPFCGRSVAQLVCGTDKWGEYMGHYVECGNPCYARGPMHEGNMAIRLWNEGLPRSSQAR